MNRELLITVTAPGKPPLRRALGEIYALIAGAMDSNSADIRCMLLDAGKPVTLTMRGQSVTFTPEAAA